ncbi:hypothetical protein GJ496_009577 [Pomphorhynchus laevis]|nr:hypothetical protein GJ496_009577 [Pomphorhynchus laevis]
MRKEGQQVDRSPTIYAKALMPKIISMANIQRSVETPYNSSGPFNETQQDKTEPMEQSSVHITNRNANALLADS